MPNGVARKSLSATMSIDNAQHTLSVTTSHDNDFLTKIPIDVYDGSATFVNPYKGESFTNRTPSRADG